MKIVFLDSFALNPDDLSWAGLAALGHFTAYPRTAPHETLARVQEADVIITNKVALTASILAALPKLKLIIVAATGYNVVDIEAARRQKIPVCNVPGYGAASVAQWTWALILGYFNRVEAHQQDVAKGGWSQHLDWCYSLYPSTELAGKTLGLIGFGQIGQQTARIAQAFDMQVMVYTRTLRPSAQVVFTNLETVLRQSDVVSLHCPLTEENQGLINTQTLQWMKPKGLLVNTARGGLIDETALHHALKNGQLGGAALDVLSVEPPPPDHVLLHTPNCWVTPHAAWRSYEARARLLDVMTENLAAFQQGHPKNVVNGV